MEEQPSPNEIFQVYRLDPATDIKPVSISAASPYEAALALDDEARGEIVVISPNGMQSRFGYRSHPKLVHLDD